MPGTNPTREDKDKRNNKPFLGQLRKYTHVKTKEFCRLARSEIYPLIRLPMRHNSIYSAEDFLDLLTHVAATHDFTQDGSRTLACERKERTPAGNTVLYHIKKLDPRGVLAMFERVFEKTAEMARAYGVLNKRVDLAIDYTTQLYYGDVNAPMIMGTKPERGTSYGYMYATVSIVEEGRRLTLFAFPRGVLTSDAKVVEILLRQALKVVRVRTVYLDRWFYSSSVINKLEEMGVKFLMPATRNKRVTRVMEETKAPAVIDYRMGIVSARKRQQRFREDSSRYRLVIAEDEGQKRAFATNLEVEPHHAHELFEMYRKRWGIETSYRVKTEFRARTTSKNYAVRLFYFLFSTCLYNLWILANVHLGKLARLILEKPLVTAKLFGTMLYKSFFIDEGG